MHQRHANWIVSRNYVDRKSEYKWLLRRVGQDPKEAIAFKKVVTSDLVFCPSTSYEIGFGCRTVGYAREAYGIDPQSPPPELEQSADTRLEFSWDAFYRPDGRPVPQVTSLVLDEDGSMTAGIPAD